MWSAPRTASLARGTIPLAPPLARNSPAVFLVSRYIPRAASSTQPATSSTSASEDPRRRFFSNGRGKKGDDDDYRRSRRTTAPPSTKVRLEDLLEHDQHDATPFLRSPRSPQIINYENFPAEEGGGAVDPSEDLAAQLRAKQSAIERILSSGAPSSPTSREFPSETSRTSFGNSTREDEVLPEWALEGDEEPPVWLQMMGDFLFNGREKPVLLDVDASPLPFFGEGRFCSGEGVVRGGGVVVPEDIIVRDFRYLHIPHGTLRRDIWHRLEHEQLTNSAPLAIFGGSPFVSRQAETILREEGFTQLCNVQTYKYLRKLVQICGTDRAA